MASNGQTKTERDIEREVIERLADFNESLRRGDDICKVYTTRKVHLKLEPTPYDPKLVKETRQLLKMSQSLFAQFLGVNKKTVQGWEQGSPVNPMACRFMDEIRTYPDYWRQRLSELLVSTNGNDDE
ncbi:helix-turn-helix domain-containing protein [Aeoliella sp.]|uniref:helix-turn-helix domain-containing protein n=1 Tax=Aeoliella sp. TaxID=2795800 RepID=UPI003CCB77BE